MAAFEELGLTPELIAAIEEEGWLLPTPIQTEAIPLVLGGGDVCAAAETGSGKTGAFGLPLIQLAHEVMRGVGTSATFANVPSSSGGSHGVACEDNMMFQCTTRTKNSMIHVKDGVVECYSSSPTWRGAQHCGPAISSGKFMYEVMIDKDIGEDVINRVGWTLTSGGKCNFDSLGSDNTSTGYGGTGKKAYDRQFADYPGGPKREISRYWAGHCIGCYVNADTGVVGYMNNGVDLGEAWKLPGKSFRPAVCGKSKFKMSISFDNFKFPKKDYIPFAQANIAAGKTVPTASGPSGKSDGKSKGPIAIVLEPTRDLADQSFDCISRYSSFFESPPVRCGLLVGGNAFNPAHNVKNILSGEIDIIVATVPRLMQLVRQRNPIDLSGLKFLVLDEADELMKENKQAGDIVWLQSAVSSRPQTLVFSATLHGREIKDIVSKLCQNETWVDLKGKPTIPETVHAVVLKVNPMKALPSNLAMKVPPLKHDNVVEVPAADTALANALKIKLYKPQVAVSVADKFKMDTCLIFCRTNLDCDLMQDYLTTLGGGKPQEESGGSQLPYSCVVLAGKRDQRERFAAIDHFKEGRARFMICTDVAARGLDISELPFIIMMTLPHEPPQFIHRVGRVGRAGKLGLAVVLVGETKEKVWYHTCNKRECLNRQRCCIWYDEPKLLKDIQSHLAIELPQMNPTTFNVDGLIDVEATENEKDDTKQFRRRMANSSGGALSKYGKSVSDQTYTVAGGNQEQYDAMAPAIDELKVTEKKMQSSYLKWQSFLTNSGIAGLVRAD